MTRTAHYRGPCGKGQGEASSQHPAGNWSPQSNTLQDLNSTSSCINEFGTGALPQARVSDDVPALADILTAAFWGAPEAEHPASLCPIPDAQKPWDSKLFQAARARSNLWPTQITHIRFGAMLETPLNSSRPLIALAPGANGWMWPKWTRRRGRTKSSPRFLSLQKLNNVLFRKWQLLLTDFKYELYLLLFFWCCVFEGYFYIALNFDLL